MANIDTDKKSADQELAVISTEELMGMFNEKAEDLPVFWGSADVKAFPVSLDKEKYEKAKPHLQEAWKSCNESGKSLKESVQLFLECFGPEIKGYLKYFLLEKRGLFSFEEEASALDEMFAASLRYRHSREYMELLNFINRFPKYSPFNCFLLHVQNPAVSYVATAGTWFTRFQRKPKRDARPLVILAPMSPVLFVYDMNDTEGKPLPENLLRPFETKGALNNTVFDRVIHNCSLHGIAVHEDGLAHSHAGSAMRLTETTRKHYKDLNLPVNMDYLIILNKSHCLEDKYSSLAHEIGHIFCGHLGISRDGWWQDGRNRELVQREIEAESVAYLVCRRIGLSVNSDKYLSGYNAKEDKEMPFFSLNAVLLATAYIEEMGKGMWKKPKKKGILAEKEDKK